MATTPNRKTSSEPEQDSGVLQNKPTTTAAEHGDHDRIVMASRRPDGTPDQINPEYIGDKDTALAAAREQLAVQAVSAVDVAARGVSGRAGAAGPGEPDAEIKALKETQEKAAATARSRAEREVEERHQGLGD
jgi:hypothetical protein